MTDWKRFQNARTVIQFPQGTNIGAGQTLKVQHV